MAEPFIAAVYKSNDERIEVELPPLVYETWSSGPESGSGSTLSAANWSFLERVGELLNERPTTANARKPLDPIDTAVDVHFESGKSAFVRVLVWRAHGGLAPWYHAKLFSELDMVRWLEANASSLPVPRFVAFDEGNGFLITTVMPGVDVYHSYHRLSMAAKERSVISWARVAVRMFRVAVPQRFGTVENTLHLYVSPDHTFDASNATDLLSFFQHAIVARRTRSLMINTPEAHKMLCRRLDCLLEGLKPAISRAQRTPSMARFALTHRDLNSGNIMLDETSGEVVGVVDWEYHACMPACMSAEYPSWIRGTGVDSPLYNPAFLRGPQAERNRLCDLYEKTVKELDEDYYDCLLAGIEMRDALKWIEIAYNKDDDGSRMARWAEDHLVPTVSAKL